MMTFKKQIIFCVIRVFMIAVVAAAVQIVVWNWFNWSFLLDDTLHKNQVYTQQDFESVNWVVQDKELVSQNNPILIQSGIDGYVRQLQIDMNVDPLPPYVQIYYTNTLYPDYDDEAAITMDQVSIAMLIDVNDDVKNLRIDLGDDPGTVLQSITITVNPVEVHFSGAIVVAVVLIYLFGRFLFCLMQTPEYGIADVTSDEKKETKS